MRNVMFVGAGILLAVFFTILYIVIGALGLHGELTSDWHAYCEAPLAGAKFIKQPACFWSDLGFIIVGFVVLIYVQVVGASTRKFLTSANAYSFGFGLIVLWMGPGSMLEHGTLNNTWGWFDASSIHWFGLLTCGLIVLGWLRWLIPPENINSTTGVVVFYLIVLACAIAIGITTAVVGEARLWATLIILAATILLIIIDFFVWITGYLRDFPPPRRGTTHHTLSIVWIFLGLCSFVLAMGLWLGGQKDKYLCPPGYENEHVWQAHAGFHLLSAIAILFIWLYFIWRERQVT